MDQKGECQELRLRIAKMLHDGGVDFLPGKPAWTPAVRLYILIADAGASDWLAAAGFWKAICGDSTPNVDYLQGFALGIVD
jgi:hypothetical protein